MVLHQQKHFDWKDMIDTIYSSIVGTGIQNNIAGKTLSLMQKSCVQLAQNYVGASIKSILKDGDTKTLFAQATGAALGTAGGEQLTETVEHYKYKKQQQRRKASHDLEQGFEEYKTNQAIHKYGDPNKDPLSLSAAANDSNGRGLNNFIHDEQAMSDYAKVQTKMAGGPAAGRRQPIQSEAQPETLKSYAHQVRAAANDAIVLGQEIEATLAHKAHEVYAEAQSVTNDVKLMAQQMVATAGKDLTGLCMQAQSGIENKSSFWQRTKQHTEAFARGALDDTATFLTDTPLSLRQSKQNILMQMKDPIDGSHSFAMSEIDNKLKQASTYIHHDKENYLASHPEEKAYVSAGGWGAFAAQVLATDGDKLLMGAGALKMPALVGLFAKGSRFKTIEELLVHHKLPVDGEDVSFNIPKDHKYPNQLKKVY